MNEYEVSISKLLEWNSSVDCSLYVHFYAEKVYIYLLLTYAKFILIC